MLINPNVHQISSHKLRGKLAQIIFRPNNTNLPCQQTELVYSNENHFL